MVFQCINIRQVPWEVLKTAAFGLCFQHLLLDLANVNALKTMFDPYNEMILESNESTHTAVHSQSVVFWVRLLLRKFWNGLLALVKALFSIQKY